ncbi:MAG: acyl carrier protein [Proteobacteria bacterium]|nr:acyl carrier protein [Pseudomonadota bacterium]
MSTVHSNVEPNELNSYIATEIAKELKVDANELSPHSNLRELPGVESIKVLRIIARIEQKYDIELVDDVVFQVNTIQDISDAVRKALDEG